MDVGGLRRLKKTNAAVLVYVDVVDLENARCEIDVDGADADNATKRCLAKARKPINILSAHHVMT